MKWLTKIFGGSVAEPIEAIGNVADKLFTSDEERLKAQHEIEELRQKPYIMQIMTNLTEAAHRSIFVAGWRPAIGWVGAWALFSFYIPKHFMAAYLWWLQCLDSIEKAVESNAVHLAVLPAYPISLDDTLMELILGMLGLGFMRTMEKFGGKTK